MLARCARIEPARMRAPSDLPKATCKVLSFSATVTSWARGNVRVPFVPLMVTRPGATVAVTPCGRFTGFLATRNVRSSACSHDAQTFAALAKGAGLAVDHHALRRRDDHCSHATEHLGQLILAAVNAQASTRHTLETVDHGTAVVVLQVDGQT